MEKYKDLNNDDELVETPKQGPSAATNWEGYVRGEINSLLDTFLPTAVNGNVGVRYKNPIISQQPGGIEIVYDKTKATAVQISLVFKFSETIDIPIK